jgi:hypothetical protein
MTDESKPNEKSAGQLAYERRMAIEAGMPPWDMLHSKTQQRWEWNASVTPKNQTIKAP